MDADGNPSLLYLTPHTRLPLGDYRYEFHRKWQQVTAPDSAIPFVPHITVLKIQNPELFEVHRNNIEALIDTEIRTIQHLDVNARNIALYAVNSKFREEIQIPLS